ncbi:MAG TPA: hypothetical protein VFM17_02055, partial [Candidatus Eisenbacteria bacterium]|nr:hypothetical protein [Candidatus Eisenbacteria bacterium]
MIELLPDTAGGPHPVSPARIGLSSTKRPGRPPTGGLRVAERLLDLALASTALCLALPLLGLFGPILLAAQGILGYLGQASVASDFVDQYVVGGDIYTLLDDLTEDSSLTAAS